MTHKPGKAAVAKHLVELRREAVATLKRFNMIAERLNFYKEYLALSKTYDVQMAGPFLVIEGGQSQTEQAGIKETDSRSYLMAGRIATPTLLGARVGVGLENWRLSLAVWPAIACEYCPAQKHIPNR